MSKKSSFRIFSSVFVCATAVMLSFLVSTAASADDHAKPSLIVTDEPAPEAVYRPRPQASLHEISDDNSNFSRPRAQTLVGRKVSEIRQDLGKIEKNVTGYNSRLQNLQREGNLVTSQYYNIVATINSDLQSGTTPGNPELLESWNDAQSYLTSLSDKSQALDDLASDLAAEATKASYVLDTTQASFGLSGAVKDDHKNLTDLEDQVNETIVQINRLLNTVQDEISRRTNYLRTERLNLETLSLAIANGEFYGHSISNRLFRRAAQSGSAESALAPASGGMSRAPAMTADRPRGRKPLVVIRFDRPNVNYEQAVYSAVGQALEKYPAAAFEIVAVSTMSGNPAEVSLAASSARKNSSGVLRTLTQMGLPSERIQMSETRSSSVANNEVHIFVQ